MADIKLAAIRKTFADPATGRPFEALRGIDLEIASGESFALLGPSGCGKTTLLRILAGLDFADSGTVMMDGRDVTRLAPEKRPTAMVFQSYALFPHLSVFENVAFGLRLRKRTTAEIRRKVDEVLDLVQLEGLGRRRVNEISGGQQQRVALARVLAVEPTIILMDEPLSNLDASLRRSTRSAIRRIQTALGLTMVYVTHDQEEGLTISDRLTLMMRGELQQVGTPRELFERPSSAEVARFLGERNMLPCVVREGGVDGISLRLEAGGDKSAIAEDAATIRVSSLTKIMTHDAPVWLALRPEEIVLKSVNASAGEGLPGRVALVSFAGGAVEVEVELGGLAESIRVRLEKSAADDLHAGDAILVSVRPGAGLIFENMD